MYKINDDFFSDMTDMQTVFVDIENGIFYLLPVFANLVLNMLLVGKSISDIKDTFSKIDYIPSDYASRIDNVIEKLNEYKLILPSKTNSDTPPVKLNNNIIQALQESDFDFDIVPSDDVQKLLLDDPIHDVSLDGWNPISK